jgi:hypothetical protein
VEYCTSVDLHTNPNLLDNYKLLVSVGHDEYWSKELRDNVEAFIDRGGNVAFFSGNVCWWQIRFENSNRTMVCYRDKELDQAANPTVAEDRITVRWHEAPVNRPEERLTGVSFAQGAFWSGGRRYPRPMVGYRVQFPQHWVFDRTNLLYLSEFGAMEKIVGYETDAADADYEDFIENNANLRVRPNGKSPQNMLILAFADLRNWDLSGGQSGWATMGIYENGGTVFTAATTDWSNGLNTPEVSQITRNVLERLGN